MPTLVLKSWYNDIYTTLGTTLPNNGVTTGITALSIGANDVKTITASDYNTIASRINGLQTNVYVRHLNWSVKPTSVTAGQLIRESNDKTNVDAMIEQMKRMCGQNRTSNVQTYRAQTGCTDFHARAGNTNYHAATGCTDFHARAGNTNYHAATGCTDFHARSGNTNYHAATGNTNYHAASGCTDFHARSGNTNYHAATGNPNTGNYNCTESGNPNTGNYNCSQTARSNGKYYSFANDTDHLCLQPVSNANIIRQEKDTVLFHRYLSTCLQDTRNTGPYYYYNGFTITTGFSTQSDYRARTGFATQSNFTAAYGSNNYSAAYGNTNFSAAYGSNNYSAAYGSNNYTAAYGNTNFAAAYGSNNYTAAYGNTNFTAAYGSNNYTAAYGNTNFTAAYFQIQRRVDFTVVVKDGAVTSNANFSTA